MSNFGEKYVTSSALTSKEDDLLVSKASSVSLFGLGGICSRSSAWAWAGKPAGSEHSRQAGRPASENERRTLPRPPVCSKVGRSCRRVRRVSREALELANASQTSSIPGKATKSRGKLFQWNVRACPGFTEVSSLPEVVVLGCAI